jgi:hypothetical protein
VKDWQPTPDLGTIPVGGRLFCWWDRGMETSHRCSMAYPRKRQEQVPHNSTGWASQDAKGDSDVDWIAEASTSEEPGARKLHAGICVGAVGYWQSYVCRERAESI